MEQQQKKRDGPGSVCMRGTTSIGRAQSPRWCMGLYQVAEIRRIPRAQSFIIVISASDHLPLRTIKCCSVVFGVTLRIHSVVSRQKKTNSVAQQRLMSLTPWSVRCITASHSQRFLPTPAAFNAPVRGLPSENCHPVCC